MESATVTPRFRDGKNLAAMKPVDFVAFVVEETKNFR